MKADTTHLVKMISILLLGILVTGLPMRQCLAAGKSMVKAAADCARKSLSQKDCNLTSDRLKVHVWQDKIFVSDGVYRDTAALPLAGDAVEWHRVGLKSLGKRKFVEFEEWAAPEEKTGVQTRTWTVYEWADSKIKSVFSQPVQKRKHIDAKKFKYDPPCKYGLREQKKTIVWSCDRDHGSI